MALSAVADRMSAVPGAAGFEVWEYLPSRFSGVSSVVEFQGQYAAGARYSPLTKIGLYGEEHPGLGGHGGGA